MAKTDIRALGLLVVALLAFASCGKVTPIATVPDAENALITTAGRLFASGSFNLYEISRDPEGSYLCFPVLAEEFYFTGLGEYEGYLYALKNSPGLDAFFHPEPALLIADLQDIAPAGRPQALREVFIEIPLPEISLPNGLAIHPAGYLYISDSIGGKIHWFTISGHDPQRVDGPFDSGLEDLKSPNGLATDGDFLYFTDGGSVKRAKILAGGVLQQAQTVYSGRMVLDDLTVYQDTLVVCDYLGGTIFQLSAQGEVLRETPLETFAFPSSVKIGAGPMFGTGDVIVTEKGIIYEPRSGFGNRVVLFQVQTP